jgi:hypothetical protein
MRKRENFFVNQAINEGQEQRETLSDEAATLHADRLSLDPKARYQRMLIKDEMEVDEKPA